LRLTKDTGLTGKHIKKAQLTFDNQTGKPQVALIFTDEGGKLFAKITEKNVGKPVAIYLDQFLLSAPVVQQKIEGGSAVITGNFTVDEAKKLAIAINSGALPLPIKLVEQKNIGPTLGASEVRKSVYAGVVGLFLVILFMVFYLWKIRNNCLFGSFNLWRFIFGYFPRYSGGFNSSWIGRFYSINWYGG
jgi:preprotein translocase subunit SecD